MKNNDGIKASNETLTSHCHIQYMLYMTNLHNKVGLIHIMQSTIGRHHGVLAYSMVGTRDAPKLHSAEYRPFSLQFGSTDSVAEAA